MLIEKRVCRMHEDEAMDDEQENVNFEIRPSIGVSYELFMLNGPGLKIDLHSNKNYSTSELPLNSH